jgi:hypothetical protein
MASDKYTLSAQDILDSEDTQYEDIPMPEWKKKGTEGTPVVWIKTLSAFELQEYTDAIEGAARKNAMVLIVMRSLVSGPGGEQLFQDNKQLAALQKKSVRAFKRLQDRILEINELKPAQEAARKNA